MPIWIWGVLIVLTIFIFACFNDFHKLWKEIKQKWANLKKEIDPYARPANSDEPVIVSYELRCYDDFDNNGKQRENRRKTVTATVLLNGVSTSMVLHCLGAKTVKTGISSWGLVSDVKLQSDNGPAVRVDKPQDLQAVPIQRCIEAVRAHALKQHEEFLSK